MIRLVVSSIFWGLLLCALSSCTFQSSQLETLRSLVLQESPSVSGWKARLGTHSLPVTPVFTEGLTVFAGERDDAATFDGWSFRAVIGFSLDMVLEIDARDGIREYTQEGSVIRHHCKDWNLLTLPTSRWVQDCEGDIYYQNIILLDEEARIIEINQVVAGDGTRLVVTKQE